MTGTLTIARVEARRIFASPLAWAILAVMQVILGIFFILYLNAYTQAQMMSSDPQLGVADYIGGGLYGTANVILLLVVPLMTMRLFAEERKNNSLTLLLSAPASLTEIVLGKFLGLASFLLAAIALLAAMSFTLEAGTALDTGRILAGLLGLLLMMLAFGAAGLFISTLTREPVIAAVATFGVLLVFWILGAVGHSPTVPFADAFNYLSLIGHFENLRRGVVSTMDVAYYLLFILLFLWLAVLRLDMERN
ncbi:MAG: ABC transporter permease [Nevskiaceae bacterium]|nr:MAG: ABC transporter permease [Nevskiaceae bacterium]TBR74268.1 MAG: ABC transporter permease [Nevskiaceae bacterium]